MRNEARGQRGAATSWIVVSIAVVLLVAVAAGYLVHRSRERNRLRLEEQRIAAEAAERERTRRMEEVGQRFQQLRDQNPAFQKQTEEFLEKARREQEVSKESQSRVRETRGTDK